MKTRPDISSNGFGSLHRNGNQHHYENGKQNSEQELLISSASLTALQIQKFETPFLEQVPESANRDQEYIETRGRMDEGTTEKRRAYYKAKNGFLY